MFRIRCEIRNARVHDSARTFHQVVQRRAGKFGSLLGWGFQDEAQPLFDEVLDLLPAHRSFGLHPTGEFVGQFNGGLHGGGNNTETRKPIFTGFPASVNGSLHPSSTRRTAKRSRSDVAGSRSSWPRTAALAFQKVTLGLVTAREDAWLVPRFHSAPVLKACAKCEHVADFSTGGHGALLSPSPPKLDGLIGDLINDPPGFDRAKEVPEVNGRITAFFAGHLDNWSQFSEKGKPFSM